MSHRMRLSGCLLVRSIGVMTDVLVFVASVSICGGTPIFDQDGNVLSPIRTPERIGDITDHACLLASAIELHPTTQD
jgi:hypothetical protein